MKWTRRYKALTGPFLERPGNLTGPKSYHQVSRNIVCVLTSNEVNFVSLADNFIVQFSNLLKVPFGMEDKTGLVITRSFTRETIPLSG